MKGKHETFDLTHRPNLPGTQSLQQPSLANVQSENILSLTRPPCHSSSSTKCCAISPCPLIPLSAPVCILPLVKTTDVPGAGCPGGTLAEVGSDARHHKCQQQTPEHRDYLHLPPDHTFLRSSVQTHKSPGMLRNINLATSSIGLTQACMRTLASHFPCLTSAADISPQLTWGQAEAFTAQLITIQQGFRGHWIKSQLQAECRALSDTAVLTRLSGEGWRSGSSAHCSHSGTPLRHRVTPYFLTLHSRLNPDVATRSGRVMAAREGKHPIK